MDSKIFDIVDIPFYRELFNYAINPTLLTIEEKRKFSTITDQDIKNYLSYQNLETLSTSIQGLTESDKVSFLNLITRLSHYYPYSNLSRNLSTGPVGSGNFETEEVEYLRDLLASQELSNSIKRLESLLPSLSSLYCVSEPVSLDGALRYRYKGILDIESIIRNISTPFICYCDHNGEYIIYKDEYLYNVFKHPKRTFLFLPNHLYYYAILPTSIETGLCDFNLVTNDVSIYHRVPGSTSTGKIKDDLEKILSGITSQVTAADCPLPSAAAGPEKLEKLSFRDSPLETGEFYIISNEINNFNEEEFMLTVGFDPALSLFIDINEPSQVSSMKNTRNYVLRFEGKEIQTKPVVTFNLSTVMIDNKSVIVDQYMGVTDYKFKPEYAKKYILVKYTKFDLENKNISLSNFRHLLSLLVHYHCQNFPEMKAMSSVINDLKIGTEIAEPKIERDVVMKVHGQKRMTGYPAERFSSEAEAHQELARLIQDPDVIEEYGIDELILRVKDKDPCGLESGFYVCSEEAFAVEKYYPSIRVFYYHTRKGYSVNCYSEPRARDEINIKQTKSKRSTAADDEKANPISTLKILGNGVKGNLPTGLSTILGDNFSRVGMGNIDDQRTLFRCVEYINTMARNAMIPYGYSRNSYGEKDSFGNYVPGLIDFIMQNKDIMKQETYEFNDRELSFILNDKEIPLLTSIFYRGIEEWFGSGGKRINLFVFNQLARGEVMFEIPNCDKFHARSMRPDLPFIILLNMYGTDTTQSVYPHPEIVQRENKDEKEFIFINKDFSAKLMKNYMLSNQLTMNGINNLPYFIATCLEETVENRSTEYVAQYIDETGKLRALVKRIIKGSTEEFRIVIVPPSQPLKLRTIDIKTLRSIQKWNFSEIQFLDKVKRIHKENGIVIGVWISRQNEGIANPKDYQIVFPNYKELEVNEWEVFYPIEPTAPSLSYSFGSHVTEKKCWLSYLLTKSGEDNSRSQNLRIWMETILKICFWLCQIKEITNEDLRFVIADNEVDVMKDDLTFYNFDGLPDFLPKLENLKGAFEYLSKQTTGLIKDGTVILKYPEMWKTITYMIREYNSYATEKQRKTSVRDLPRNFLMDKIFLYPKTKYTGEDAKGQVPATSKS